MANVRFIPRTVQTVSQEDLAIANQSTVIFPEESMWVMASDGDLTVSTVIAGRMGSWVSRFNLNSVDSPPLIEWEYKPTAGGDAVAKVQDQAHRAQLRVSNLDIQPHPHSVYPDTHWVRNGLDITPRSSN